MRTDALASELDPISRVVEEFEAAWQSGPPPLHRFRDQLDPGDSAFGLGELVKADLKIRYRRGERPDAREYLDRFPELSEPDGRALSLIYEEYCLRSEAGEAPDASAFCDRYPAWRDSLAGQLSFHRVLSSRDLAHAAEPAPGPALYPEVGGFFDKFLLIDELGDGGNATVFLARDPDLGHRMIALKVSTDRGSEPAILGQLDHPNIVPVVASVIDRATGLRGLCMPYRPGPTLDKVARHLRISGLPRRAHAVRDLAVDPEIEIRGGAGAQAWADFPEGGTFADAVAWIGLKIASALVHAHGRGFLHRDVKPENILLTAREGPQLIDFHLAHAPDFAEEAHAAQRGGTLPYMAPEHLQAFLDPAHWGGVGAAADLYSLGLVLRELLTGQPASRPPGEMDTPRALNWLLARRSAPPTPIRRANRAVPQALQAIVDKCLAPGLAARYDSAAALAEDLRLYLDRRDPVHAPNPSVVERSVNRLVRWRIPIGLASGLVALGLIVHSSWPRGVLDLKPTESTMGLIRQAVKDEAAGLNAARDAAIGAAFRKKDAVVSFLALAPDFPQSEAIRLGCGYASLDAELVDQADRSFREALGLNGRSPSAFFGLAQVELKRKNPEAALAWLDKAIPMFAAGRGPGPAAKLRDARQKRILILIMAGDQDSERKDYLRAFDRYQAALADLDGLDPGWAGGNTDGNLVYFQETHYALAKYGEGKIALRLGWPVEAAGLFRAAREHLPHARAFAPVGYAETIKTIEGYIEDGLKKAEGKK